MKMSTGITVTHQQRLSLYRRILWYNRKQTKGGE